MGCWRADGTFSAANNSLLTLLRCSPEDIHAGRIRWQDITPREFAALDAQALEEIRRAGECTPFEKEYVRSDGTRVPVLVGAMAFGKDTAFAKDTADAGAFYVVDLSHRKRMADGKAGAAPLLASDLTERQRIVCLLASYGVTAHKIAAVLDQGLRTIEADKQRAAKTVGIPTSRVTLWAAEHRRELITSLERCGKLPALIAEFATQH